MHVPQLPFTLGRVTREHTLRLVAPIDAVGEHFLGYYRIAGEFLSGEFLGSLNSNLFY